MPTVILGREAILSIFNPLAGERQSGKTTWLANESLRTAERGDVIIVPAKATESLVRAAVEREPISDFSKCERIRWVLRSIPVSTTHSANRLRGTSGRRYVDEIQAVSPGLRRVLIPRLVAKAATLTVG